MKTKKSIIGKNYLNIIVLCFSCISAKIETPPTPTLLVQSMTSTSLALEWKIPEPVWVIAKRHPKFLKIYLVQWRYEESSRDWKNYRNQSMDGSTILVGNLQPYTMYRVGLKKLRILIIQQIELCFSYVLSVPCHFDTIVIP